MIIIISQSRTCYITKDPVLEKAQAEANYQDSGSVQSKCPTASEFDKTVKDLAAHETN